MGKDIANGRAQTMDVVKTGTSPRKLKRPTWIFSGVGILLLALIIYLQMSNAAVAIDRKDIVLATVQKGELLVQVDGYGVLRSNRLRVLTSINEATVKEILLRPGSVVSNDSVIAILENPELEHLVQSAEQDVARAKANLRQLRLNQHLEMLKEEADLADLKAQLETIQFRREAEQKLNTAGVVSQITFQETVANENQLKSRVDVQQKRLIGVRNAFKEGLSIQEDIIAQMTGLLDVARDRRDRLQVRADFVGVVQRLSVEEGQAVAPGQEIAMIGSIETLVAVLRVPQSQAHLIQVGQAALIDTRRDKIKGQVTRIDPVVSNNTVSVEIALPVDLPASARPEQNVEGFIEIERLANVFYMERPAGVRSQGSGMLYQVNNSNDTATLKNLEFGFSSGRLIEVRSGAKDGDQFITSDLTRLNSTVSNLKLR